MTRRLRVGFLLPAVYAVGNPFNGIREQARAQADALEALGHEVVRCDAWQNYPLHEFDVIQYFTGGPAMSGIHTRLDALACRTVFAPIIDSLTPNWQYRLVARLGRLHPKLTTIPGEFARQAARCDVVIVRSRFEQRKLVQGLGVDPGKIRLVLNGCSPTAMADPALARRSLGIDGDFLLHISRYTNQSKNVVNLIRALEGTEYPLIIAGSAVPGAQLERIRAVAAGNPRVRILGQVDEKLRDSLYAACRVFCLPSEREGTGLVALEAAAQGARVVITSRGGPPDYFEDHVDYVSTVDPGAIRRAIDAAWCRPDSQRLRQHVRERLSWQRSAERLVAAYGQPASGADS